MSEKLDQLLLENLCSSWCLAEICEAKIHPENNIRCRNFYIFRDKVKQWFLSKKPKEKEPQGDVDMEGNPVQLPLSKEDRQYNQALRDWEKNLEEE